MPGKITASRVSGWLSLAIVSFKIYADIKKHADHKSPHDQRCACLTQCFRCTFDAAIPSGE